MTRPELHVVEGGDPVRQQAAAWFARLRADDVTERDRERWQQWLATHPDHLAAYQRIERLWSSFGEHAPHPEIALRVRAADPPTRTADHRARKRPHRWLRWAGAMAISVAVVSIAWTLRVPPATDLSYATAVGERRTIALEDGSKVDLDTDSYLRVHYSGSERRLTLDRGRAFFRVAKEKRPLVVHTSDGAVRAVGTQFEVYRRADEVEVALFEGRVQLLSAEGSDASPVALATLDPGQKARFSARDPRPRIESFGQDQKPAWLSGRLVFDDAALTEAVAEFNRYSQRRIIADDRLERIRISGVFRIDDPQAFIDAVCITYGLSTTTTASGDTMLKANH